MKQALQQWIAARSPREHWVLAALLLLGVGGMAEQWALAPLRSARAQATAQMAATQAEFEALGRAAAPSAAGVNAERLAAVQARRARAEAALAAREADLVSAHQMQGELAAILERMPEVRIVGMKNLAPVNVGNVSTAAGAPASAAAATAGAAGTPAAVPAAAGGMAAGGAVASGSAAPRTSGLYRHGLEVTVEARYLDLIRYLDALEHAPHRIYWHTLTLSVDPGTGQTQTRIAFYTLSREATWLSL